MQELRPIEEIREEAKLQEIFKLMDLLNEGNIEYEFYDRSYTIPIISNPFLSILDPYIAVNKSMDELISEGLAENKKFEHYQIIIYKENSLERLISIIELPGYNDRLEIMSDSIYVHDKYAMEEGDVEQYLTARQVFDAITNYYYHK